MKRHILGTIICLALIAIMWMVSGCLSVSLVGGRHQSITLVMSDNNEGTRADMEAASKTTDLLNDLLRDADLSTAPTLTPGAPPSPDLPSPPPTPSPPGGDTPTIPGEGGQDSGGAPEQPSGDNTFLWKPVSKNDGRLVVLTPACLEVDSVVVNTESLTYKGRANGNRQHWRGQFTGGGYGTQVVVLATLADDRVLTWTVPRGDTRSQEAFDCSDPTETPASPENPVRDESEPLTVLFDGTTLYLPPWLTPYRRIVGYPDRLGVAPTVFTDTRIGHGWGVVQVQGVDPAVVADLTWVGSGYRVTALYSLFGQWPYPVERGDLFGAEINGYQKYLM